MTSFHPEYVAIANRLPWLLEDNEPTVVQYSTNMEHVAYYKEVLIS